MGVDGGLARGEHRGAGAADGAVFVFVDGRAEGCGRRCRVRGGGGEEVGQDELGEVEDVEDGVVGAFAAIWISGAGVRGSFLWGIEVLLGGGPNVHMAIGCSASPTRATCPAVRSPFGGGQSYSSRNLTSVSSGMLCASDRNGSAQVAANCLMRAMPPALVSGKLSGDAWPKKPGRIGHEMAIWHVYLPLLPSGGLFPGASSTGIITVRFGLGFQGAWFRSPLKYTNESF